MVQGKQGISLGWRRKPHGSVLPLASDEGSCNWIMGMTKGSLGRRR